MDYFNKLKELFEGPDGDLFKPKEKQKITTTEERLVESFEQIAEFVRQNGRLPDQNADDLKEAGLGVRLASIRIDKNKIKELNGYDELGLLEMEKAPESLDELFANEGNLFESGGIFDVNPLPNKGRLDRNMDDIAKRRSVKDFENCYKKQFVIKQKELECGISKLISFGTKNENPIQLGDFYVYDGMMCKIEKIGEFVRQKNGYLHKRLRIVYENGTESNMTQRSFERRLYDGGMVVVDRNFEQVNVEDAVGYIYILKSLSNDPNIVTVKDLYKIGVTTDTVESRIKNAENDPTYLMSPVKIVASYKLTGEYQPLKVESLIHHFFNNAKVDLEIIDNLGRVYIPDEWYSAPIEAIEEMVNRIDDRSIVEYYYDNKTQQIKEMSKNE
jgi:hypothetical protein